MPTFIQPDLFQSLNNSLVKQVGVDEVGRGCLAGPVVACACFAEEECELPQLFDSKVLSAEDREDLFLILSGLPGFHFAYGVVSNDEIDQINILQATFKAMKLALRRLPYEFDQVLVDGSLVIPGLPLSQKAIIKGDAKVALISAASVMAKVFRDHLMALYDRQFPKYGFKIHKGYGTQEHLKAIREWGPTTLHRMSFEPLAPKKPDAPLIFLPFEDV